MNEQGATKKRPGEALSMADVDEILALVDLCKGDICEIAVGDLRVRVERKAANDQAVAQAPVSAAMPAAASQTSQHKRESRVIASADVGHLHWIDVEPGSRVAADQPVYCLRGRKRERSFTLGVSGTIRILCVTNGAFVEYGQPILFIDED